MLMLLMLEYYLLLRFFDLPLALRDRGLAMPSNIGAVPWLLIFEW